MISKIMMMMTHFSPDITESPGQVHIVSSLLEHSLGSGAGPALQLLDVDEGSSHAPGHVSQGDHTHQVPVLQSPDEHVQEVDEGELNESSEHRHEADDDEDIQSRGVSDLRLGLATESYRDNSQDCSGSQLGPGRSFLTLVSLDQPEGDPGAHHDNVEGNIHLCK